MQRRQPRIQLSVIQIRYNTCRSRSSKYLQLVRQTPIVLLGRLSSLVCHGKAWRDRQAYGLPRPLAGRRDLRGDGL